MNRIAIALHITGASMAQTGAVNGAYEIPESQTSYPGWETFVAERLVSSLRLTHGTIVFVQGFHVSDLRSIEKPICVVPSTLRSSQSPKNGSPDSSLDAALALAGGMPGPQIGEPALALTP